MNRNMQPKIHRSATTYSVQNSISDTLSVGVPHGSPQRTWAEDDGRSPYERFSSLRPEPKLLIPARVRNPSKVGQSAGLKCLRAGSVRCYRSVDRRHGVPRKQSNFSPADDLSDSAIGSQGNAGEGHEAYSIRFAWWSPP